MSRVYLLLTIVGVAVIIYSIIDVVRSDHRDVRSIPKTAWVLVVLFLPLIGAALWFAFGRPVGRPGGPQLSPRTGPVAPDDDPDFLRNLEIRRRQQARAEELRAEELRREQAKREQNHDGGQKPREDGTSQFRQE